MLRPGLDFFVGSLQIILERADSDRADKAIQISETRVCRLRI